MEIKGITGERAGKFRTQKQTATEAIFNWISVMFL